MLPVAPQLDQPPAADRSTWKHEAIRRGHLRITGPPPADLPPVVDDDDDDDNDDNDDAHGDADANDGREDGDVAKPLSPKRFTDSHALDLRSPHSSARRRLLHKASLDIGHRVGISSVLPSHKRTSTEVQETILHSSVSLSGASAMTPTALGRPSKRQKRGSLSAAFKKIFGGSKRRVERERSQTASPPGHSHHRSEPQVRRPSPSRTLTIEPRTGTSDSDDVPSFTENLGRGTPNQLPFPMNVNAPQEESGAPGYVAFNRTPPVHRRRATLPSVLFTSTEASTLSAIWSDSASKHEDQRSIKDEIGIAVSGPEHRPSFSSHGPSRKSNRRSRSAGALGDLRKLQEMDPSVRASIAGSLWQSTTPGARPQTAHVPAKDYADDVTMEDDVFETPGEGVSRAESRDTVMHANTRSLGEHEIQAFDFGPFRTGPNSPAINTPPAFQQQFVALAESPGVPLDQRLERLESNMRCLDDSLRRLHGRQNRQTIILENAPPGRGGHARNWSSSSEGSPRYGFIDPQQQVPSPVSLTSSPQNAHFPQQVGSSGPTDQMSPSQAQYSQNLPNRSLPSPERSLPDLMSYPSMTTMSSAPTVVATAGFPPPSSHSYTEQYSYASDQVTALYSLLYHERAARKDLESQVNELRREMGELRLQVEQQYARGRSNGDSKDAERHSANDKSYIISDSSDPQKSHVKSNIYSYAAYPRAQNAYPTPSPDVSILLGTTTTSSTEQLAAMHPRISQLNYEEEAAKQRKSRFSFDSDDIELSDSGLGSKRHSGSVNNAAANGRASPGSRRQSMLRYGGPVVANRSSSVYDYDYPPEDEAETASDDAKTGMDDFQTPLEEPESPPPRNGEEVFAGVGACSECPPPMRKISVGRMI